MTLEQFKKKEKPKSKSKLLAFEKEILELINDNYSHRKIAEFLNANGVKTSRVNVTKWVNRNKTKKTVITQKVVTVEKPKAVEIQKENVENTNKKKKKSLFKKSENVEKNEILEADLIGVVYS